MARPAESVTQRGRSEAALVAACSYAFIACCGMVRCGEALAQTPPVQQPSTTPVRFGETLLLDLRLNGVLQRNTARAVRVPEGLALPQTLWQELQLRPPGLPARLIDSELHLILADGPGELIRWSIEEHTQTLVIDAPPQAFTNQQVELNRAAAQVTLPPQLGFYMNYDAQWQRRLGGASTLDGLADLGALTSRGDLLHRQLYRSDGGWVRLDTRWTIDRAEHLASWRVGDSVGQPGSWGQAMRFGGLQWSTDFSLQPGFLSFPLPTLKGEAALPSTVDIFVNNSQRLQGRVQPGPFDIADLPVVTGQGTIRTVVRDLLGREQVTVQPYYVSPALLKPGLSAFSVDTGWLRENYGLQSNRYGRAIVQGTWRRGLTDRFTGETRAEVARDQQAAGVSGVWLMPALGTLSLGAVASRSRDPQARRGGLAQLGFERQGFDWSGSLEVRRASRGFAQLGQAVSPRWSGSASLGTQWRGWSLGIGRVDRGPPQRPTANPALDLGTRLWSLNAGRGFGRWGFVGASLLKVGGGGGTAISVFWTLPIGLNRSLSTSWQAQRGNGQRSADQWQLQFQHNAPFGDGVGYQLSAAAGGRREAQAQWQNDHVALSGGVSRLDRRTDVRAGISGALATLGGSAFTGRRVEGGFAVVEVAGHPGVRVTHDHQVVARTDARGRAFLPSLRGYQVNRVGVIADDLPLDADIEALELQVAPAARSASLIRFPISVSRAATFRLVDTSGRALPPGTEVRLVGGARWFPVGLDGKSFVTGLAVSADEQVLDVRRDGPPCRVTLRLPPGPAELPDLSVLVCR